MKTFDTGTPRDGNFGGVILTKGVSAVRLTEMVNCAG